MYRLIDPRNGETFYVGRGKGNCVFAHAADDLGGGADVQSEKLLRIRKIRSAGFDVAHVIHRHGLDSHTAVEVEAALIDAYPGTANIASGHEADERGVMHADEIMSRYQAPVAQFEHDLVLISVNWSALERSIYEAVRHAWKIDPRKAAKADYVLAIHRGLIVGAFKADNWLRATLENFPGMPTHEDRWGFVGREAPEHIQRLRHGAPRVPYLGRAASAGRAAAGCRPSRSTERITSHHSNRLVFTFLAMGVNSGPLRLGASERETVMTAIETTPKVNTVR